MLQVNDKKIMSLKKRRLETLRRRGSASLYGLYISILIGLGSVGFLSNVGNAVRISSTSQVDSKMRIMADASLDIAGAQLDEVLVRSAVNNGDQGDWKDIYKIENAVLGVFDKTKGSYGGLDMSGAAITVNLTDLPDRVYDGEEMTLEEVQEYAKQNGLGESEFKVAKEAMLEAVIKIGEREVRVTKEVGHQHEHRAKFFGVEIEGRTVFVFPMSTEMKTLWAPFTNYKKLVPDGAGDWVYQTVEKAEKIHLGGGYRLVKLEDVIKTNLIAALRDMRAGEDAFAAVVGGGGKIKFSWIAPMEDFNPFKSGDIPDPTITPIHRYKMFGLNGGVAAKGNDYRELPLPPVNERPKGWKYMWTYDNLVGGIVQDSYDVAPISESSRSFFQDQIYSLKTEGSRLASETVNRAFQEFSDEKIDTFVFLNDGYVVSSDEAKDFVQKFNQLKSGNWSDVKFISLHVGGSVSGLKSMQEIAKQTKGLFVSPYNPYSATKEKLVVDYSEE